MRYLSVIRYQSDQEPHLAIVALSFALSQSTLINRDNPTVVFAEKLICVAKVPQFLL